MIDLRPEMVALAALAVACDGPCRLDVECPPLHVCSSGLCTSMREANQDAATDGLARPDGRADAIDDPALPEADREAGPGVRALLVTAWEATDEPLCDLDGDGLEDNALGDADPIILNLVTTMFRQTLETHGNGVLLDTHLWEDTAASHVRFDGAIVGAADCDEDGADNLLGGELFDAHAGSYDPGTAEPLSPLSMTLTDGRLEATFDVVSIPMKGFEAPWVWRGGRLEAAVVEGFDGLEDGTICTYARASELAPLVLDPTWDRSVLDIVVAPGSALSIPGLPGLQPDIDLDGDGLETFVADAEGRVAACFDGDGTQVSSALGEPCAMSSEIVDAISMAMLFDAVWARLLIPGLGGDGCPSAEVER